MDKSLKQENRPYLAVVFLANIALYFFVYRFGFDFPGIWNAALEIEKFAPLMLVIIFIGVINSQINPETKAKIVFWKITNPLPGCRAFSDYVKADSRIDIQSFKTGVWGFP